MQLSELIERLKYDLAHWGDMPVCVERDGEVTPVTWGVVVDQDGAVPAVKYYIQADV